MCLILCIQCCGWFLRCMTVRHNNYDYSLHYYHVSKYLILNGVHVYSRSFHRAQGRLCDNYLIVGHIVIIIVFITGVSNAISICVRLILIRRVHTVVWGARHPWAANCQYSVLNAVKVVVLAAFHSIANVANGTLESIEGGGGGGGRGMTFRC